MLDFVFDLPLLIAGPALAVILGALAVGGLLLVRRHVLPRLHIRHTDSEFISTTVHSVMVFYGLTVALIAIAVWESYSDVSQVVSHEATTLAVLYRNVSNYPPPERTQLQDALREYVEYVIKDAWPEQQEGRVPFEGEEWISRLEAMLMSFEPRDDRMKLVHAATLRTYDEMIEARRMRLEAVETALPGTMWTVILVGAALGVIGSYFFVVADVRLHVVLVALLSTFVAMVIFVVLAFDRPFRGDMGIDAGAYQLVYDQLMKQPNDVIRSP